MLAKLERTEREIGENPQAVRKRRLRRDRSTLIRSSASHLRHPGETIQTAYKARMNEYHPDKVAHLGEDLQKLAHRKALEIQRAYQQLSK